jgi:regulatory protein
MSEEASGTISACYRKAIELLGRRDHFVEELRQKLLSRGFEADEVGATLSRLEQEALLDDRRAAEGVCRGSFRRKGFGPRRIRAELQRRGVDGEIVEEMLAEAFAEGEGRLVKEVAQRWLTGRRPDRAALARHLERKGFSPGAILSALEDEALEQDER